MAASSAPNGRLGFFSDVYYDALRNEWWALSDRGPGGLKRLELPWLKGHEF
jgi:hypothetical protein